MILKEKDTRNINIFFSSPSEEEVETSMAEIQP